MIRQDGMMSVGSADLNPTNEYAGYNEVFIGNAETIASENVMDARVVNKDMDALADKYYKELEAKKHELDQEFELKRQALEHEYEMKMKDLETEMPKRFEQGEWVSGKTLSEIIKTLVTKQ